MQRPLLIQMQRRSVNVFAVFADSVRRQVKEHKDLTKNIELLGESSTKLKESETVLKASAAISQTSKATSQMLNAVGSAVNKTLEHPVMKSTGAAISHTVSTVSHVSQQIAEPILDTQAARTVGKGISQIKKDVIGSASNAFYQEYKPREERMRERQEMIQDRKIVRGANGLPVKRGPVAANDEAMGIELHQGSRIASAWSKFKSESELGQRLFGFTQKIDETDSPFMNRVRGIRGSFNMNENETATVVRALRQVDPEFSEHAFLKEVTQFTAPDLIEAYLGGDLATLRIWCGERVHSSHIGIRTA